MQTEANCPNCGRISRVSDVSGTAYCQVCELEFAVRTLSSAIRAAFYLTANCIKKNTTTCYRFFRARPFRIALALFGLAFVGYLIEQPRRAPSLLQPFESTSFILTRAAVVIAIISFAALALILFIFWFDVFSELRKRGFLRLMTLVGGLLASIALAILSQISSDRQLIGVPQPEIFRRSPPTDRVVQMEPPSDPVRYISVRSPLANDLPPLPLDEIPPDISKANMDAYRSQVWRTIFPHLQKMRDCELRDSRGAFQFEYEDAVHEAERCKVFSPHQYVQESYAKLTGHSALAMLKPSQ